MTRKEEIREKVDYPSDAHTRLKHAFYRRYIACWMGRVLQGRFSKPATLIEGFSGSGRYSDGPDGSAVMIAKLFREHIHRANFQDLRFVTNDFDDRRCHALQERLDALAPDSSLEHTPVGPRKFEDIVDETMRRWAPPGRQTLWIIDPYGLKPIPWSAVAECVKRPRNDAIITVMIDEMHRYRSNPVMSGRMDETFGTHAWSELSPHLSQTESKEALVQLYRKQLENLGCLTSSFNVDVRGRKTRYALIFATHHSAGLECWNDARWAVAPADGKGASAATAFQLSILDPDIHELLDMIKCSPGIHEFSTIAARATTLGFKETHVRAALDELFAEGRVFRISPAQSPKNSPWPATATIRIYTPEEVEYDNPDADLDD